MIQTHLLTPVVEHDQNSDSYMMFFNEYPNAIVVAETLAEAEGNLVPLVELMITEKNLFQSSIV